jgi:hypothetical protein
MVHRLLYLPENRRNIVWSPDAQLTVFLLVCGEPSAENTFRQKGEEVKKCYNEMRHTHNSMTNVEKQLKKAEELAATEEVSAIQEPTEQESVATFYYSDWQSRNYSPENFLENFRETATQFRIDTELAKIADSSKIKVRTGDSRSIMRKLPASFFDLLITSPPYLNSMDYSDVYRPELFLGGFVTSNEDLSGIRLRTVRSHLQVNWRGKIDVTAKSLENPLAQLKNCEVLWNAKLPKMVEAYFHDMQKIFRHASRVLKPKAQAWIVVSTSAYAGIPIPVDLILAEIATQTGFELSGIYVMRSLRAAGQQQTRLGTLGLPLRESLIVLAKS